MTALLVLGLLLRNGTMSGYSMQVAMENTQTDKWAYVKPASIYYALNKLEENGFVNLNSVEKTGHRSKALYSITEKGKQEYKRLIKQGLEENSVVFPSSFYTSLTFIDDLSTEEILYEINKQYKKISTLYSDMKNIEKLKININQYPENVQIIFKNIFGQCEVQLNTLDFLKKTLSHKK